jgi:hypothetical protein
MISKKVSRAAELKYGSFSKIYCFEKLNVAMETNEVTFPEVTHRNIPKLNPLDDFLL